MKGQLTVIKTDGTITVTELSAAPALEILQKSVGGWLETVPYFAKYEGKPCVAFCNEEGKIRELPFNSVASDLWWSQFPTSDALFGDIVILRGDKKFLGAL